MPLPVQSVEIETSRAAMPSPELNATGKTRAVRAMFAEIDLLGAFVPAIATWFVGSLGIFVLADLLLTRLGFFRLFWHAPLARFGLFVCLFCLGGLTLSAL